jgi:hypothetical protein
VSVLATPPVAEMLQKTLQGQLSSGAKFEVAITKAWTVIEVNIKKLGNSSMKTMTRFGLVLALMLSLPEATTMAATAAPARPQGPCDIYGAAGDACVAAHSTTRALYASYNGPLYQVMRQSDGKLQDIGIVAPAASDAGGYADAAAQDAFCANTICWITKVYDQSPKHNDLFQAPRGAFSGPAMGGFNNLPIADMAPVTVMGHKVYGVYIMPGMGIRRNDPVGTAVDDQAQGQYWVIDGTHFNNGCCFDYGNAEIDSKDDGNGTMETTYYGNSTGWYHGTLPGPWVMTDQENNLVGCVNKGTTSKLCHGLPDISWRFVTGMAKGEPHRWASLGGDAQRGPLQVMFDGRRVDVTYDPMRKQGAILLGNGGDNSNSSQGTFYEGAMTAAGTFPTHDTDQKVQANVVSAGYAVARLALAPASAAAAPPGLQTFALSSSQETVVTFTNTTGAPVSNLKLGLTLSKGWTATAQSSANVAGPVAPGASVNATFKVMSGAAAFNGDLVANASYTRDGKARSDKASMKVRNASPIKINEFRVSDGSSNATNAFIELYNAGSADVDISGWTLTHHQIQQSVFGAVKVPAGTRLAGHGFYLLGLSTSGLAVPARAGDSSLQVRSTTGLTVGDTVQIDTGAGMESRKVTAVGSAATSETTLWQPAENPTLVIPAGSTNVPVTSTAGFEVGQKIAIGYGTAFNAVARTTEKYEVAAVTAVGKAGTQAFLGTDAAAGAASISVTDVANITVGDKIRLDIDSKGHGIETVTVKRVGTPANWLALAADAKAGSNTLRIRRGTGVFNGPSAGNLSASAVGHTLIVGMPDKLETVTITAMTADGVTVTPALSRDHLAQEVVVDPGTGLELAAPLKFAHAGNLPFSARGTGISFSPAARFAHSNNEPVQALGTGITLDRPLAKAHAIHAAVQDGSARNAGYQGTNANLLFGGPALSTNAGTMVLRDAGGRTVDSLNYGLLVDPWASEGFHTVSGTGQGGCRVATPGTDRGQGRGPFFTLSNVSAGRAPDGADSDSNCKDFHVQPATTLVAGSAASATNIKVGSVADFAVGQPVMLDTGANMETATIASIGTAGATNTTAATAVGDSDLDVGGTMGFVVGQAITIDREEAVVAAARAGNGGGRITVTKPLSIAHAAGAEVSGSGITLAGGLNKAHARGAQVITDRPTPGAPNRY